MDTSSLGKVSEEKETKAVSWKTVLQTANGRNQDGTPNAAAMMSWDRIQEDGELQPVREVFLEDAVFQFAGSCGCVVAEIRFPLEKKGICSQAYQMCRLWFQQKKDQEDRENAEILSMTVVPHSLRGQLYIWFGKLVYARMQKQKEGYLLLLGIDNTASRLMQTDTLDYDDLTAAAERAVEDREAALDQEYAELLKERRELEHQKFVEAAVTTGEAYDFSPDRKLEENQDRRGNHFAYITESDPFRSSKE